MRNVGMVALSVALGGSASTGKTVAFSASNPDPHDPKKDFMLPRALFVCASGSGQPDPS
jgi:hypothetical protein